MVRVTKKRGNSVSLNMPNAFCDEDDKGSVNPTELGSFHSKRK